MSQVVVVVGGGDLSPRALSAIDDDAVIVAADGGLDHAVEARLRPGHLVGDLDSLSASGRMWAYAHGVEIDEHPIDKDATDTELALARAIRLTEIGDEHGELLVVGGVGDRLDHLLGVLLALGHPSLKAASSVRAFIGDTDVVVVHPGAAVHPDVEPGTVFSALALHGACRGVEVRGAEWELIDADLAPTEARGVSNVAKEALMISVREGVLTVVFP
jgi:thiamine pyrophosphokinase